MKLNDEDDDAPPKPPSTLDERIYGRKCTINRRKTRVSMFRCFAPPPPIHSRLNSNKKKQKNVKFQWFHYVGECVRRWCRWHLRIVFLTSPAFLSHADFFPFCRHIDIRHIVDSVAAAAASHAFDSMKHFNEINGQKCSTIKPFGWI